MGMEHHGNARILTTQQADDWRQLVEDAKERDIHFEPEYLRLFEEVRNEEARLFVFGDKETYVAYPFFIRRADTLPFFVQFKRTKKRCLDVVSPWYFGGPIARIDDESIEIEVYKQFLDEFHTYCVDNEIITEFARLHPFFRSRLIYPKLTTGVMSDRPVVYVDLHQDEKTVWQNFKKSNKNAITKARRLGIQVEVLGASSGLQEFQRLYNATMKRKSAGKQYFFPPSFFEKMATLMPESTTFVCARFEGRTIASSLFLHKYGFVYYYLSGSDERFLDLCPNNVILHEAILWARGLEYKYLVLGGGHEPYDDLFRFKRSFSDTTADFYVYKKVHDIDAYKELCQLREAYDISMGISSARTSYFPEYRRPPLD